MPVFPIKVLLQTTIPTAADDRHIARFSLLGQFLREQRHNGAPLFEVTMRDRGNMGAPGDVSRGCPSFVSEAPGTTMAREPDALRGTPAAMC